MDALGHLMTLHVTPTSEQDRAQVVGLSEPVQEATGDWVEETFVHQGYTGDDAASFGFHLDVVNLPEPKRGLVLSSRRREVERSLGWMARFRRLARGHERLSTTRAGLHHVASGMLMRKKAAPLLAWSSEHALGSHLHVS